MFDFIATRIPATLALLCAPLWIGCFASALEPDADPAHVVVETRLPGSPVAPARLVVTLASSARDTLRDTVTENGSRLSRRLAYLDARAGVRQSVFTEYALAPNRRWRVSVRVLDRQDSLQMADSGSLGSLAAFERREAALAPVQRFAACPARFVLPASHASRRLQFTRLQLLVDGKVVRDTLASSRPFAPGEANAIVLAAEHLARGTRHLTFNAYGRADENAEVRLLFKGGAAVEANPGEVVTTPAIALAWVPDASGESEGFEASADADVVGLHITIGKVGKVVLTAHMSGEIDF